MSVSINSTTKQHRKESGPPLQHALDEHSEKDASTQAIEPPDSRQVSAAPAQKPKREVPKPVQYLHTPLSNAHKLGPLDTAPHCSPRILARSVEVTHAPSG
jgi:hypothetical protein